VALGIGIDGVTHPLALVEGSTENATLVTVDTYHTAGLQRGTASSTSTRPGTSSCAGAPFLREIGQWLWCTLVSTWGTVALGPT
jgi:hypothetical protein